MTRKPKKSAVAIVKKEVIEIESDTDTDDVGGNLLALCGGVNASAKNLNKSFVANTIVKKEILEIESDTKTFVKHEIIEIDSDTDTDTDTDEVAGRTLALSGEVNASGDNAKNPNKSVVAKTIVKKEIMEIESHIDDGGGRMLALRGEVNALGDDSLANNLKKSAVAKTIVKKETLEIESATDTDEVGGRRLALCGELDGSRDDSLANNLKKSAVAKTIVNKEIIEIESDTDTDEVGGRRLALCGELNASRDDSLANNLKKSAVAKTIVKKEIIEIESATDTDTDTDEVDGRMLALCGEVNALKDGSLAKDEEINRTNMQIVCADDCNSGLVHDLEYKKYLECFGEMSNLHLLEENVRGSSSMCLISNVDNEASDRSKGRAVKNEKSRPGRKAKSSIISSVSKRLKTENGRADHKSVSGTVLRTKETQQKKGDARRGRKISAAKNTIELKPTSYVRDTQQKNGDVRCERKTFVAKNTIELKPTSYVRDTQQKNGDVRRGRKVSVAKKNVKLKPTINDQSQTIFRASKRLKTEIGRADHHNLIPNTFPVVDTKDTQRKKQEALEGRKIHVTKHNVLPKSTSHVKDNLLHSVKARKKENEETLSSLDKHYEHYLAYLRNSIIIFTSDRQVEPEKDIVCLSDPDIIAVSNHPFPDGGKSPFEATKDSKVIDLEDGIEPDDIFNSSFSKKLMDILRKPYDENEFLRLYDEASLKRPLTRSRQLRDGREIDYNVKDQLALSYLEKYKDFNKKYHHYRKDLPRALNLLRGFFFYLENIVLEGAFKPWLHEKRLTDFCFDARECKAIVGIK